jgi:hypothetical protein
LQLAWGGKPARGITDCNLAGVSCSTFQRRLGVQAHYHFTEGKWGSAWLGVNWGFEWFTSSAEVSGPLQVTFDVDYSAFEILGAQAGYDLAFGAWRFGPFVGFTLGSFGDPSATCQGDCQAVTVTRMPSSSTFHGWFFLGARATFLLDLG